jgi:epoxyqueuosine reductase
MSLTDEVKNFGYEIGLDIIRVTSAEPLQKASERIRQQIYRGLRPKWNIDVSSYCNPKSVLPDAKSVIVAAECYLTSEPQNLSKPGDPHGTIARYTWRNYYYDVKTKLRMIANFLKERIQNQKLHFKCYSNGPLAEKPLAERAGVGWFGKHSIIVTKEYGSWIVLGELVVNVKLDEDDELNGNCGSCHACMDACPTNAIIEPFIIDVPRCLQYLSHTQLVMPYHVREIWGNRLYGCMTCQEICPVNRRVKPKERKPKYGEIGSSLPLIPILQMNESQYRKRYRQNQIGEWWVSFGAIQRNAIIALGNIGDPTAIPTLVLILRKSRSTILRMHAAWAIGKIGGHEANFALKEALKTEKQLSVVKEIKNALRML